MSGEIQFSNEYKQVSEENTKITIQDVADALGISKTTVSRAISGKGRIGEATRQRVLEYIEKNDYKPNPIAKGLAQQRTYNIGWVMPGDTKIAELPFFQKCMAGVSEEAASVDYDVLLSLVYKHSITNLERLVKGNKVDGIVLGRTLVDDENVSYLKASGIPFVAVGSTTQEDVIQVDNDHVNACKELTISLLNSGIRKFVLIGGKENHVVNQSRKTGYELGLNSGVGDCEIDSKIYMNSDSLEAVEKIVDSSIEDEVECIICMDDLICNFVLECLQNRDISIPDRMKIASFYNSEIISSSDITAVQFNPKALGAQACKILISYINGEKVPEKTHMNYQLLIKGSTK